MSENTFRLLVGAGDGVGIVSGESGAKPPTPPAGDPAPPAVQYPDGLGDPGKRALDAERSARATAESAAAALQQQLDAINTAKLTDLEQAQAAAKTANTQAAARSNEALRLRFALDNGVPSTWVDRLHGDTADELAADWVILQPTLTAALPGKGTVVPGAGHQPPVPPSLPVLIAAAEASGDAAKAMALKTQQLAGLAGK